MKVICEVFASTNTEGMYLYVNKQEGLARAPEALLTIFGTPKSVMTMLLEPTKKLAKADAEKVLSEIEEKGYYLQMPSEQDDYMADISEKNSKLPRAR